MARIGVITVNYHSSNEIKRLRESLCKHQDHHEVSFYIVDASGEYSLTPLENSQLNERHFPLSENIGFAAACNQGIEKAISEGCEYIWLLNPDISITAGSISALMEEASKSQIVGSIVLDDENQIWGAGGFISQSLDVSMGMHGSNYSQAPCENLPCDYIPGCSLFFQKDLFEALGKIPEEYFLYFEETDWCLRAKKKGISCVVCSGSTVIHHTSVEKMQAPMRVYFYNRSMIMFKLKFGTLTDKLSLIFKKVATALTIKKEQNHLKEKDPVQLAHSEAIFDALRIRILKQDSQHLSVKRLKMFSNEPLG